MRHDSELPKVVSVYLETAEHIDFVEFKMKACARLISHRILYREAVADRGETFTDTFSWKGLTPRGSVKQRMRPSLRLHPSSLRGLKARLAKACVSGISRLPIYSAPPFDC